MIWVYIRFNISPLFLSHNFLSTFPISFFIFPYITYFLCFRANTIWYLHLHFVCIKLLLFILDIPFLLILQLANPLLFWTEPEETEMKQKSPKRRIKKKLRLGGFFTATKGQKRFGDLVLKDILKMKTDEKSNRRISDFYGFKNIYVIKQLISRYHRKQKTLDTGIVIRPKGRHCKNSELTDE